jgi:hypothetical protein
MLAKIFATDSNFAHAQIAATKIFWIDDVWLTGFVASALNIPRLSLNSFFTVYR